MTSWSTATRSIGPTPSPSAHVCSTMSTSSWPSRVSSAKADRTSANTAAWSPTTVAGTPTALDMARSSWNAVRAFHLVLRLPGAAQARTRLDQLPEPLVQVLQLLVVEVLDVDHAVAGGIRRGDQGVELDLERPR